MVKKRRAAKKTLINGHASGNLKALVHRKRGHKPSSESLLTKFLAERLKMANDNRDTIDLTINSDSRVLALRAENERKKDFARYEQTSDQAQRILIARELSQRWGLCS